ncbi:pre-mRNA-splicing factor rse1 [Malassezia vespertilionis]|uniref:Pre-mRNA-splicing factor RSE1 n=1 Tax=Malassezia vespertilionis TaxID=2020962 RepID=A0A2N1JB24_9BASI|nr:pre-mRNA-splicing factor rse1 [Malassezia vespertilionis]PKI83751.1 Rse1p [Malassezia vespertilionis]WFD07331.1 pre-mRNA-splicing factor rse1 [Malassezia vespertilionis]
MHLYNLTLEAPTSVTAAAVGQLLGTRQQEIVLMRGSRIEMYKVDVETGKYTRMLAQNMFGNIRSIACFRLTGGAKDYLILGSDSGRIAILEYSERKACFEKVHLETFGRSGNRRIIPGQFLATDPKGRAVLIGAVEKGKLIYILNRDSEANLTISSPLEANRATAVVESIVGVDVGYENPMFASLEMDYGEADQDSSGEAALNTLKNVVYYELDLGLNHVVRRWAAPVDHRSNHLIQVPGGYNHNTEQWDGPSGVLVCAEDYITYRHQGQPEHRVPIPRRRNCVAQLEPSRGSLIIASVLHKMKNTFFFLVQNEDGDLFKLTLDHDEEEVQALRIKYFETVPVAVSLCILRAGFLYVASETGAQQLYSFQKLGDEDEFSEYVSTSYPHNGASFDAPPPIPSFVPCALENIALVDEHAALDTLMDAKIANPLASDSPQMYTVGGRGARSAFRQMRHGMEVDEVVSSDLPGVPNAVWSTKLRQTDEHDSYIVLSFVNGTLVLRIGETIEEVVDSGFMTNTPTLTVQQIGPDAILQVHPLGIRHILGNKQVNEWPTPVLENGEPTKIVAATANDRQVVIALNTNEIVYFELDMEGQLNEYQERRDIGAEVLGMSVAGVPQGHQRTPYLAIGCADQTVRIVSLDPDSTLSSISIQALTALPKSICVNEMLDVTIDRNHLTMFVSIGLENGVYLRTVLDPVSGQLTDTRPRFLGSKPVSLMRVHVHGQSAVVALSSRNWLSYSLHNRVHFTPLIYEPLEYVWSFTTELCPQGLIGIVGDTLRIFTLPHLGSQLKMETLPLSYTPRKMAVHPTNPALFYVVESENRALSPWTVAQRIDALGGPDAVPDRGVLDLDPQTFGLIRGEAGQWASCLRVVHGTTVQTTYKLELQGNEAAFSVAFATFTSHGDEPFLVVGSAVDTTVKPHAFRKAYISTYKLKDEGRALELLHKTEIDQIPLVMHAFHGRLLVGTGAFVRIYEMGTRKLLRKVQSKPFPTTVVTLNVHGYRIVVGDMQESVHFLMYKPATNSLTVFADDTLPRWTTSVQMLDHDTVVLGDKFGSLAVLRLDESVSRTADEDPTGLMLQAEKPFLMGAANKLQLLAHFHVGDIPTSISLASLVPGGRPIIVYMGLAGTVGALVPFVSKEDAELMSMLEMHLRQEDLSLVGRDHMAYRGAYVPVKSVVDSDLCELYGLLPPERQVVIAESLDRTPNEISKKLAQLRESAAGF